MNERSRIALHLFEFQKPQHLHIALWNKEENGTVQKIGQAIIELKWQNAQTSEWKAPRRVILQGTGKAWRQYPIERADYSHGIMIHQMTRRMNELK